MDVPFELILANASQVEGAKHLGGNLPQGHDALEGKLEGHDHEVRYVEGAQRTGHLVDGRGERDDHGGAHAHEEPLSQ
ncbi:MAG: hypothetical protein LKE43_10695 [Olsenella sp.]|jgi:hypothetical protein|nr:hypothetical protein [Olsenella sp.]